MPTPVEILSDLHTVVVDAVKGYDEGASIAKRDDLGALCKELKTAHMANAHEIAGLLLKRGERPSADGSFMSTVHKLVLNTRFLLTADEKSLLPALRDGEMRILTKYDQAQREAEIADAVFTTDEQQAISTQRDKVVNNLRKIDAMDAAAA